jgi:hypothetical protein
MDYRKQIFLARLCAAALTLSVVSASYSVEDYRRNGGSYNIDEMDECKIKLYRVTNFQGSKVFSIRGSKSAMGRRPKKSLRTIGNCCWALYAKNNFKGRPMLLGGQISLKNVSKWGWGSSSKIRSIRRLDSCDLN